MANSGTHRNSALRRALSRARHERHRRTAAWVSLGSGVFAFGVGLCIWSAIDFEFRNPFEIVSRITLARYPKQQDLLAYAIAVFSVAGGVAAGWYAWCALAAASLRASGGPDTGELNPQREAELDAKLDAGLTRWAWPLAAGVVSLVPIAAAHWGVAELVVAPLLAAGLAALASRFTFRGVSDRTAPRDEFPSGQRAPGACDASSTSSWPPLPSLAGVRTALLAVVVPLLLYAWLYDGFMVHHRIDMHHEGEILAPWAAIQHGAIPFKDIYVQHGLFQNVGKGWLSEQLFGASLAALRSTEHLLGPLGHLALYFLGLAVFRSWLSAVVLVLVASVANLWAVDRQALGLLAVAALAYGTRAGQLAQRAPGASWLAAFWSTRMAALSGVATTLAFFYSAEVGIFSLAACGGFLAIRLISLGPLAELRTRQRWLPLASYLAGAVVCLLPFVVTLASFGALDDLIRNTWRQLSYQPTVWGRAYPSLIETLQSVTGPGSAAEVIFAKPFQWYLPPLIYLVTIGYLSLRTLRGRLWREADRGALLLVALAALCYFASALSRADAFHLKFGSLLMWLLVGLALESAVAHGFAALRNKSANGGGPSGSARLFAIAWPAIVCGMATHYLVAVHEPIAKWSERAQTIASGQYWPRAVRTPWARLGGIRISDREFAHLRKVVAYLRTHSAKGEAIYDFSNQPAYYFLANRPNPTRYALPAYAATGEMQREVIEDLEHDATQLVIYRSGGYLDRLDRVPSAKRNALIKAYLQENYDKASQIGETVILLRKAGQVR